MKRLTVIALILAMATTAYGASLDMTITASSDYDNTDNQVGFDWGGWFDLAISVDPTPGTYFKGLSLFLTMSEDIGAEIAARNIHGVAWAWGPYVVDPTVADGTLFSQKNREHRALNPSTSDLGATTNNPAYGDPAGQLMTLRVFVPDDAPLGQYSIVATGSTYVKEDNSAGQFDTLSEIIVYTGVPEPASLALLALGGFALLRRR